ncbi:MAG: serine dehydratase subunit alpha family protein [Anaerotruncus sp.]|nr:serine dehydratase subunit alpha family protein [Anaerotruncus sp.]
MDQKKLTMLLKKEMVPALGCTGPTAYALATACCRPYLTGALQEVKIYVSPTFLKVGFGVATPGTATPGIEIAAAVGLIGGDYTLGLQVLTPTTDADMKQAKRLVDSGILRVLCDWEKRGIYIRAEVISTKETIVAVVEHTHDGVSLIQVNDEVKFRAEIVGEEDPEYSSEQLTLDAIFSYVETVDSADIRFLLDGYRMNLQLAEAALKEPFGLSSGRAYLKQQWNGRKAPEDLFKRPMDYLPEDIVERSKILVATASDGRMGGCRLPAMAAMGDGNQGLTATLPVGTAGTLMGKSEEQICRALALSCLMLFYIKIHIGRAAAFCQCAISASAGVAAGVSYLQGAEREKICGAVKNAISTLAGILCDGAKNGCALKMATATTTAFTSVDLAGAGVQMGYFDGICDDTLEETVFCITQIATKSMELLDHCMVDGILYKTQRKRTEAVDRIQ